LGPAVLDDPIVSTNRVGSITNRKNLVVKIGIGVATGWLIVNSGAVEHERLREERTRRKRIGLRLR
jgi:hypothetical protein